MTGNYSHPRSVQSIDLSAGTTQAGARSPEGFSWSERFWLRNSETCFAPGHVSEVMAPAAGTADNRSGATRDRMGFRGGSLRRVTENCVDRRGRAVVELPTEVGVQWVRRRYGGDEVHTGGRAGP